MLNHFLTKLLDHDSYKPQKHHQTQRLRMEQQNKCFQNVELREGPGTKHTLFFLVVLLPSLIAPQGNTHAAEEDVLSPAAKRTVDVGRSRTGIERIRPACFSINEACDLRGDEGRERVGDENKIWILSEGKSLVTLTF
jgi:hypothetical protein